MFPLAEKLSDEDPTLLSPLYADDATSDGSVRRSVAQLHMLMEQGTDQGYFPEPAKSLFIADEPEEKKAEKRGFERAGLNINYIWQLVPVGLSGGQGGDRGVGAAQGGGMGPWGPHPS